MSSRALTIATGALMIVFMLVYLLLVHGFAAFATGSAGLMGLSMVLVGVEVDNKEAWND